MFALISSVLKVQSTHNNHTTKFALTLLEKVNYTSHIGLGFERQIKAFIDFLQKSGYFFIAFQFNADMCVWYLSTCTDNDCFQIKRPAFGY